MNILLITTTQNPGDSFARFGVENLVKQVDPAAEFILLDKENPKSFENVPEFDRAIFCGMPLFWSHPEQTCSEIWWWDKIFNGPITADKRKFACIGVGNALGKDGIHNRHAYIDAIQEVIDKSFVVTTRNHILGHPKLIDSVCPSLFAVIPSETAPQKDMKRLCNLMRNGAHDALFDRAEAELWNNHLAVEAEKLRNAGFEFVAHSIEESELAYELGWKSGYWSKDHRDYLKLYQQCSEYIGNRLHGAMVAFAAGAKVTAIGYDSRVKMLERVDCVAETPSNYIALGAASVPMSIHTRNWILGEALMLRGLIRDFLKDTP